MKNLKEGVVVSGVGIVTPVKPFMKVDAFGNALGSGEDAIKRMSLPMLDTGSKWLMAGIDQSSFADGISLENKLQFIAEKALCMAMKDANLRECQNAGLSIGTVLGNVLVKEKRLIESKKQKTIYDYERESLSYVTSYLAAKYSLNGPNITISTACASGTDAIGIAARKIMGYASRADANHLTGPHREGRGLADAMNQAISEHNLKPREINYINAHGTGTVYNDLMETKAIKKVFGKAAYAIPISSTKSMLGHSFGAAGAIEAICCLLSIKNKIVHPTINFNERDAECDLDYVPNIARHHIVNIAMSLSAGFGGQNSAIIFGKT